ncbi:hypothetical protein D9M68_772380 [compost metagenome]
MASQPLTTCFLKFETEAIRRIRTIDECLRPTQTAIQAGLIAPRCIDKLLPGDHVIKGRTDACVPHPVKTIDRGQKAANSIALISGAFIEKRCIRDQLGCLHARRLENTLGQKIDQRASGMGFDEVRQNTEIAIAVGIVRARFKMRGFQS